MLHHLGIKTANRIHNGKPIKNLYTIMDEYIVDGKLSKIPRASSEAKKKQKRRYTQFQMRCEEIHHHLLV